jgi:uncharacterized membrane protein
VIGLAALAWPAALGAALLDRVEGDGSPVSAVVYVAASRVCHQRPERSFHVGGTQWPVCARCAGLYLAAPLGVLLAAVGRVRRRAALAWGTAAAALPTAATWLAEGLVGLPVGGAGRFAAAAPLGAALAFALIQLTRSGARID